MGSELIYSNQSRLFSRADSVPGESSKEASLGLVWANQVNVRIMLSRTGRRRYLDEATTVGNKVRKVDGVTASVLCAAVEGSATLIRRMSVIFSSIAPPISLDYVVTFEGVSTLPDVYVSREVQNVVPAPEPTASTSSIVAGTCGPEALSQVMPLDVGSAKDEEVIEQTLQVDEWDAYWEHDEGEAYYNVDLDGLLAESNL